jgi:membrane-bound ClpP family serine protease
MLHVFVGVFVIGAILSIVSLILDHDHDFDHDGGGPSLVNSKVIGAFLTAFGGFGLAAVNHGLSTYPAVGIGFGGGFVLSGLCWMGLNWLYKQQNTVHVDNLVGMPGVVRVSIEPDHLGQVMINTPGGAQYHIATGGAGVQIPEGVAVQVVSTYGPVLVVKTILGEVKGK